MKISLQKHIAAGRLLVMLAFVALPADGADGRRPNIVFFLMDDQSYLGLGCTGNTVIKTPNMDRLAAEGVLFEKAFVTTSICCVSRASLLTGQHQRRHGIDDFAKPLTAAQMQKTFPVLLRQAGYRTAFLGKFAIGAPKEGALSLPTEQFDLWYGFPQSIAFKQMENGQPRYLTTVMTEKAVGFIKEAKVEQPFCLMVAFKEPHGPRDYYDPEFENQYGAASIPRPDSLTRQSFERLPAAVKVGLNANPKFFTQPGSFETEMRDEYALISRADLAVGKICDALKEHHLDENTVILFMSDNGYFEGAHGLDGKWLMYEESIHVPLIIRDPRLPAATRGRRSQMALNIDIAPTILGLAGVAAPATMQGADLEPVLRDPLAKGREDWFYEHTYTTARQHIPQSEGIRTERWKYIRYIEPAPPLEQLFDLTADPGEENDLAADASHSQTLSELRGRCDAYRVSLK